MPKLKTIEEYIREDVEAGGTVLTLRLFITPIANSTQWNTIRDLVFGSALQKVIAGDLVSVSIRNLGQSIAWSEPVTIDRIEAIGQYLEAAVLLSRDDFQQVDYKAGDEEVRIKLIQPDEGGSE